MYIPFGVLRQGEWQLFAQPPAVATRKPEINNAYKQLILSVKLTCFLLLAGLLQVSARTVAQTRISLSLKGVTLEKAFAEIEKRSGYSVFYNTDVLKSATSLISFQVHDATIDDVLHQCLKGLPLQFTIQDKTVFVKKEAPKAEPLPLSGSSGPAPQTFGGIIRAESGTPLAGATVYIVKLKKSAVTDKDGAFAFNNLPDGEYEVELSFVGYQSKKVKVLIADHRAWLVTDLAMSMSQLDETVVKGYYSTTNRLNTGDVTTVKGADIAKQPVTDPLLALDGRVPGLYIAQTSGVPGAYASILLRGKNSLANGTNPLYIIDGVPYNSTSPTDQGIAIGGMLGTPNDFSNGVGLSPFNDLNPADIESIEVLKDADATAIYGSRGANGVILISTKKGKSGKTSFDVSGSAGTEEVAHFMHFMNTPQYLSMRREAFINDVATPKPTFDYDLTAWDTTRYTNWQKVLIGNAANFANLQGALSGGDMNTQFRLSAGYSDQGTVFPGSFSDRKAMFDVNVTHNSANQRLHTQFSASYVYDNNRLPIGDFTSMVNLAPNAPTLYDAFGNINWQLINGNASWINPLATTYKPTNSKVENMVSSLNLSYLILPGLQVKSNFGFTHMQNNQEQLFFLAASAPPQANPAAARRNYFGTSDFKTWIIEPQIEYERNIWRGKFSALIGTTFQENSEFSNGTITSGYASDALINDPRAASSVTLSAYNSALYHYSAGFARISYNWEDKFLINLTGRRDGSSRFGPGKQFGDFGAAGAAWIFSKENFVQERMSFLSFGKLRASYGVTGNDQLPNYQYLSTYQPRGQIYQGITGLNPTGLTNPYFAWEQVKKIEGGVDLGFLKDRILISASLYRNRTINQLVGYSLPFIAGFGSVQGNLPAVLQNSGIELTLNTVNFKSAAFSWTSSINLTIPNSKLIAFPNLTRTPYSYMYAVGASLFARKLYHSEGINDTTGSYQYAVGKGVGYHPTFPADLMITRPITQKYYGGFENAVGYKNFQLSFLLQFVDQLGTNYLSSGYTAGRFNQNYPTAVLDHWKGLNNPGHYGKYSQKGAADLYGGLRSSDFIICNASFARLKNLAIAYTLPKNIDGRIGIQGCKLYLQCQNVFTITHNYLGYDPENGGVSLPPLRIITGGLQIIL